MIYAKAKKKSIICFGAYSKILKTEDNLSVPLRKVIRVVGIIFECFSQVILAGLSSCFNQKKMLKRQNYDLTQKSVEYNCM